MGDERPQYSNNKEKNPHKFKLFDLLKWITITTGLAGVIGNFSTDWVHYIYNSYIFTYIHREDIKAAQDGYMFLIAADIAGKEGNKSAAVLNYKLAIDNLTRASEGGIPRASALLFRLYCSGRVGYIEKDPVKGVKYGVAALSKGDNYGGNQCAAFK